MRVNQIINYYQDAIFFLEKNHIDYPRLFLKYNITFKNRKAFQIHFQKNIDFFKSNNQPELLKYTLNIKIIFINRFKIIYYICCRNKKMFKSFFHLKNQNIIFFNEIEVIEKFSFDYHKKKHQFKVALFYPTKIKKIFTKDNLEYKIHEQSHHFYQISLHSFKPCYHFILINERNKKTKIDFYDLKLFYKKPFTIIDKNIYIHKGVFFIQYKEYYLFLPKHKEIISLNQLINQDRNHELLFNILIGDSLDNEWNIL